MSDLTESLKDAANRASHECYPERKLVILRALDEIERLEGEVERYKDLVAAASVIKMALEQLQSPTQT